MAKKPIQLPSGKRDPVTAAARNARMQALDSLNRRLTSMTAKLISERFELEDQLLAMQSELLDLRLQLHLKAGQAEQRLVSADPCL